MEWKRHRSKIKSESKVEGEINEINHEKKLEPYSQRLCGRYRVSSLSVPCRFRQMMNQLWLEEDASQSAPPSRNSLQDAATLDVRAFATGSTGIEYVSVIQSVLRNHL